MLIIVPTFEMAQQKQQQQQQTESDESVEVIVAPIHPRISLRQFRDNRYVIDEKKRKSLTFIFNKILRHRKVICCFPHDDMTLKLENDYMSTTPPLQIWHLRELFLEFLHKKKEQEQEEQQHDDIYFCIDNHHLETTTFEIDFDDIWKFERESHEYELFAPILTKFISFHSSSRTQNYVVQFAKNKHIYFLLQHFFVQKTVDMTSLQMIIFKIKTSNVGKGLSFLEIFDLIESLYQKGCVSFEIFSSSLLSSSSSSSSLSSSLSKKEKLILAFFSNNHTDYVKINNKEDNDNDNDVFDKFSIAEATMMLSVLENIAAIKTISKTGKHTIEITDFGNTLFEFLLLHFGDFFLEKKSLQTSVNNFYENDKSSCFGISDNHHHHHYRFLGGNVWGRKSCVEFVGDHNNTLSFFTVKPEYQNLTLETFTAESLTVEKIICESKPSKENEYFSKSVGFKGGYEIILRRSHFGPYISFISAILPSKKNVSVRHCLGSRPIESITPIEILTTWDIS